jgi:hypothetical protein
MAHFLHMIAVYPKQIEAYQHKEYHENAKGGNHKDIGSGYEGNELFKHWLIF